MNSTCFATVDLIGVRVARLDEFGNPISGLEEGYASNAAVSLEIDVVTDGGDSSVFRNNVGEITAVLLEPERIIGINLSLELCQLDALLAEIMLGCDIFTAGGTAVGVQLPVVGETAHVCFEGWSRAWDGATAAEHPSTGEPASVHWVFPSTWWVPGPVRLAHDMSVSTLSTSCAENESMPIAGPFDDWPANISSAGGVTRLGGWFMDHMPAPATCEYIAVGSNVLLTESFEELLTESFEEISA